MDNRIASSSSVPMAFYMKGSTWESSPVVMYTRVGPKSLVASHTIKTHVESVIAKYRAASEHIDAAFTEDVVTKDGVRGQLWTYSGYMNGGVELATYFVGNNTLNYFVA